MMTDQSSLEMPSIPFARFILARITGVQPNAHTVSIASNDGGMSDVHILSSVFNLPKINDWVIVGYLENLSKPVVFGNILIENDYLLQSSGYNAIHGKKDQYDETFKNVLGYLEWHYADDGSLTIKINRSSVASANLNIIVEGAGENEGNINLELTGGFSIQQKNGDSISQSLIFDKNTGVFSLMTKDGNLLKIDPTGFKFSTSAKADQHFLYGEVVRDIFTELFNTLGVVTSSIGGSTAFEQLKAKIDTILAEVPSVAP